MSNESLSDLVTIFLAQSDYLHAEYAVKFAILAARRPDCQVDLADVEECIKILSHDVGYQAWKNLK